MKGKCPKCGAECEMEPLPEKPQPGMKQKNVLAARRAVHDKIRRANKLKPEAEQGY